MLTAGSHSLPSPLSWTQLNTPTPTPRLEPRCDARWTQDARSSPGACSHLCPCSRRADPHAARTSVAASSSLCSSASSASLPSGRGPACGGRVAAQGSGSAPPSPGFWSGLEAKRTHSEHEGWQARGQSLPHPGIPAAR